MGFAHSSEAIHDTLLRGGLSINFIRFFYIGGFKSDVTLIANVIKIKLFFRVGYMTEINGSRDPLVDHATPSIRKSWH
jgi:hypothetical protein